MSLTQLHTPLPFFVEGKGQGWAHFVIDYGIESHLYWVVFFDSDGSCWTIPNPKIRMQFNQTLGRGKDVHLPRVQEAIRATLPTEHTQTSMQDAIERFKGDFWLSAEPSEYVATMRGCKF